MPAWKSIVYGASGLSGAAVAGQVGRDHAPAVRERRDRVLPVRMRRAETVQQHERGPRARLRVVDADAVDHHLVRPHPGLRRIATVYATVGGGSCGAPP
jgi:hypothetical protein